MRIIFTFLLITCLGRLSAAETSRDAWLGYFKKTELDQDYSMWVETQLRFNLESSEMDQTLVRGGVLRRLGSGSQEIGLLYAYIRTGLTKEHRAALQHTMKYSLLSEKLSHRIRLEYRTLENSKPLSERFRYLLRFQGAGSIKMGKLVVWDEIFLNTESFPSNKLDHLDRNRLFIGFRKDFSNLSLEYGYLNQIAPRDSESVIDHTLVAYFFF